MSAPFTPEQETRIAEIMQQLLIGMARQRTSALEGDIEVEVSWACHWAGITPPKGEFDD